MGQLNRSPCLAFLVLSAALALGCFVVLAVSMPQLWVGLRVLLSTTATAFVLMGYDKRIAGSGATRVPERAFWIVALAGGSLGIFLGMQFFRHKTKKSTFQFVLLGIFVAQLWVAKTVAHQVGIDSLRDLLAAG